jgi:hypothetical protein
MSQLELKRKPIGETQQRIGEAQHEMRLQDQIEIEERRRDWERQKEPELKLQLA